MEKQDPNLKIANVRVDYKKGRGKMGFGGCGEFCTGKMGFVGIGYRKFACEYEWVLVVENVI